MNDERRWLKKINSPDVRLRFEAMEEAISAENENLWKHFRKTAVSSEVSYDIGQKALLKMTEVVAEKTAHFNDFKHFIAYLKTIATNLAKDYSRKPDKESNLLDLDPFHEVHSRGESIEHILREDWFRLRFLSFLPSIPNEEAQLTINMILAGYDEHQISLLLPWSEKTAKHHFDDTAKSLQFKLWAEPEYVYKPNRWDHLIFFEDGGGSLGLTYTAARPRKFSPETAEVLCQELGLATIEQLHHAYGSFLIIQNAFTDKPAVRLAFAERSSMNLNTLRGAPLYYLDGIPTFFDPDASWDGKKDIKWSKTKERLSLDDITTYKASVSDTVTNAEIGVEYLDWAYDFGGWKLQVRKLYEPKYFSVSQDPKGSLIYFRAREMV